MSDQKVVSDLVKLIWQRFRGVSNRDIERVLVGEGWAVDAVREAISIYRSTRQFI
jgi:hypothetical protein